MESLLDRIYDYYFGYAGVQAGWVIPAVIAVGSLVAGLIGQRKQAKENRKLAEFQASANEQYLDKQLEYNTPQNQMTRYQQAGLNPNLIYGQGSPGNQSAPLSYPDIKPADYQSAFANLAPVLNQTAMTASQTQAIDAKTRQTHVLTQLNKLQARVLERNPLLDSEGFKAIIDSLKSSAEIKASESSIIDTRSVAMNRIQESGYKVGEEMIFKELQLLEQRFNLGSADQAIKGEVLKSKDFQNAILEVQKKWMTNAEVTPQHILTFIQLLLMKLL